MDEKKIDYLGPQFIMAIIATLMSDFAFLIALLVLLVPVVGIIIVVMAVLFHYFVGLLLLFLIFPSLKHLIPKIALILSIIIPLPFLTIGVALAIILQNRIIEFIITQAAIAVATGGVGTAASAGVAAARIGATAAKGAEAATAARAGTLGAKAVTVEKEASLGAKSAEFEKTGASAAEKGKISEQQKDAFKDKMNARKEKLNKIVDKIHEQEGPDKKENEEIIEERG